MRANEGRIMQETRRLYAKIRNLNMLLDERNVPETAKMPQSHSDPTLTKDTSDGAFELSIETTKTRVQHRNQRLRARRVDSNEKHMPGHQIIDLTNAPARDKTNTGVEPLSSHTNSKLSA